MHCQRAGVENTENSQVMYWCAKEFLWCLLSKPSLRYLKLQRLEPNWYGWPCTWKLSTWEGERSGKGAITKIFRVLSAISYNFSPFLSKLCRCQNSAISKKILVTDCKLLVKPHSHSTGESKFFQLKAKNGCRVSVFCFYTMISRVTSLKDALLKDLVRK